MRTLSLQDLLAIDDVDALLQRAQSLALKVEDALPRSGGGLVGYALDRRGGQHLGLGGLHVLSRRAVYEQDGGPEVVVLVVVGGVDSRRNSSPARSCSC